MIERTAITVRELLRIAYAAGLADGSGQPWRVNITDPTIERLLLAIREEFMVDGAGPLEQMGPAWLRALQGAAPD